MIHSPALCRLIWLPECAAIRRLSLPPSSSLCYVGGFAPIFLSYTHVHTLSPLVVLECVLVGQRLHNTELWVPSHVFVHHDDTQASAPAEMTEETGDGDGQKSSSLVPCNDIHLIHRSHSGYGSSSVQLLQHASVYQQLLWKKEVTRMVNCCVNIHYYIKDNLAQRKAHLITDSMLTKETIYIYNWIFIYLYR